MTSLPFGTRFAGGKGRTEGISTLNQALARGLPSCCQVFGGRAHFSASVPLIAFVKNMGVLNSSLEISCTGEGRGVFTPCLTRQGLVK